MDAKQKDAALYVGLGIAAVGVTIVLWYAWRSGGERASSSEGGGGGSGGGGGGTYIAPPSADAPASAPPPAGGCTSGYGISGCHDGTVCTPTFGKCADGCSPGERKDACGVCMESSWVESNPNLCRNTMCPKDQKKDACDRCQAASWVDLHPILCYDTGCERGKIKDACQQCANSSWVDASENAGKCFETGCAPGVTKDACNVCGGNNSSCTDPGCPPANRLGFCNRAFRTVVYETRPSISFACAQPSIFKAFYGVIDPERPDSTILAPGWSGTNPVSTAPGGDVTEALKSFLSTMTGTNGTGGRVTYPAPNDNNWNNLAGDPAPGAGKHLSVYYGCRNTCCPTSEAAQAPVQSAVLSV